MMPTTHDTEQRRTELHPLGESPQAPVAAPDGPDEGRHPLSIPFRSLLSSSGGDEELGTEPVDRSFAFDLNLDQVIERVAGEREERDLIVALLYRQLRDPETVRFRQEVFDDLHGSVLLEGVKASVEQLRQVRSHLSQMAKMRSKPQREGWFLDAAAIYCDAVRSLTELLHHADVASHGLVAFRDFLAEYTASPAFRALETDTAERKEALRRVRYNVRIHGGRVEVSRYEGEPDYSAEVLKTFERFKQGAVKDYRLQYRVWPGMNHVGEQILQLVARLFSDEFSALEVYCERHGDFFDRTVRRFEREVQFYLAYLDYTAPLRSAGLPFCCPEVGKSKEVFATDTFDLALAAKLVGDGQTVVRNDFHLRGRERIFVVSGPNQGGKTTFARTFGQLHHLASTGCPVPGSDARLFLFDRLFTHFEREEDIAKMSGKLEEDLVRIRGALLEATTDSIIVLNEIFSSTTLHDARFLGKKVLAKMVQLDLLAVYVTFVDELASLDPSIVSMVSTIVPGNPAERTFKVVRGPADGLAYALAIAEKYNVTYARLRERVQR
jgi:DNA mismatch repair protein MutS